MLDNRMVLEDINKLVERIKELREDASCTGSVDEIAKILQSFITITSMKLQDEILNDQMTVF